MSKLSDPEAEFLARFVARGWLYGERDEAVEAEAVRKGLRLKYLRREGSEVHFTPAGRKALVGE